MARTVGGGLQGPQPALGGSVGFVDPQGSLVAARGLRAIALLRKGLAPVRPSLEIVLVDDDGLIEILDRLVDLADGETAVSELLTARLVRITAGSDRDRERGALLGALPGAAVLALNGAANGNSRPAVELGGVALVAAGAVLGWRLGRGRERSEVLYERRAPAP